MWWGATLYEIKGMKKPRGALLNERQTTGWLYYNYLGKFGLIEKKIKGTSLMG